MAALQRQSSAYDAKDNIRSSPISNLNGSAKLSTSSNRKQLTKIVEEINKKETKSDKKEAKTTNRKEEKSTNRKEEKITSKTKLPKLKSAPNLSESIQSSFICKPNGLKMTITVSMIVMFSVSNIVDWIQTPVFHEVRIVKLISQHVVRGDFEAPTDGSRLVGGATGLQFVFIAGSESTAVFRSLISISFAVWT